MSQFDEGTREASTCHWCHSPIWIVYHGKNHNHTEEPRREFHDDSCGDGMCWAESLKEACDHWQQEAETARAELRVWKRRLVDETARLRGLLEAARK